MQALPDKFVFMKVGSHSGEALKDIIDRKEKEIDAVGKSFWGYGGATCHPVTQIQPFARRAVMEQGAVALVMEPIDTYVAPDVAPATEFSCDGKHWHRIPDGILVTGSKYALVLEEISPADLEFTLSDYEVAVGQSSGKPASQYIKGRIDKGCLSCCARTVPAQGEKPIHVSFTAKLKDPFAVLLR